MLPLKSAGWKLNGKELPDGRIQLGNVLRSDDWETVLGTPSMIYTVVINLMFSEVVITG
ncbi:MAG TPA: hypothetical protein VJY31_16055 [Buttiauxella sp.]|nr:hypothetical protein [Buttiauxella sp.]